MQDVLTFLWLGATFFCLYIGDHPIVRDYEASVPPKEDIHEMQHRLWTEQYNDLEETAERRHQT